jgi:tRNA(fMet)-specific endonuclease VapC
MQLSLIDTDILSEVLKQKDATVLRHATEYLGHHQQFAISAMTRYEVVRGLKDRNAVRQIENFDRFCRHSIVYAITDEILDRTADLWVAGPQAGNPHRDADLIIAATALEHRRALVTGNKSDFLWIPDLTVEDWRDV